MEKKNSQKKTFGAIMATLLIFVAAFSVACGKPNDPPPHAHDYSWVDNGDGTHKQHCSVSDCDAIDINVGSHDFTNGNCVCGKQSPVEAHTHSYESKYDETHHWQECKNEGCDAQIKDKVVHDFTSGDCVCGKKSKLAFALNDSGDSYSVSKGVATDAEIVIPSTYNGKPVTAIDICAFYECESLTSVTLPDSITSIGIKAFSGCSNLTSITIGNNVTEIGYEAFYGCSSLASVTLPDSLTSIGDKAFYGCDGLRYNKYDDGLYLGNSANQYLWLMGVKSKDIASCIINDNAKFIHSNAFNDCGSLTSLRIPNNVTNIGYNAFKGCNGLTIYCVATAQPSGWDADWNASSRPVVWNCINNPDKDANGYAYSVIDGVNYRLKDAVATVAGQQNTITTATISSVVTYRGERYDVTSIGENAFKNCKSLTSVTIPDSITSIESGAFYYCENLTSITIPSKITSIPSTAFMYCSSLTSVVVPSGITSIGRNAFGYCGSLTIYCETASQPSEWGNGWNTYSCPIVWNCKNNNADANGYEYSVIGGIRYRLKDNVATVVGQPSNTKTATIPDSVTYNGTSYNVTSIAASAFYENRNLKSVTIGNNVTTIGMEAFYECNNLASVTIGDKVTTIEDSAFRACAIESIFIPISVTVIKDWAFTDCANLKQINCAAASKPLGWTSGWNDDNRPVTWGYAQT